MIFQHVLFQPHRSLVSSQHQISSLALLVDLVLPLLLDHIHVVLLLLLRSVHLLSRLPVPDVIFPYLEQLLVDFFALGRFFLQTVEISLGVPTDLLIIDHHL